MYTIKAKEPEGWEKAFEVLKDGEHMAWFRYLDDAEYYVKERIEKGI